MIWAGAAIVVVALLAIIVFPLVASATIARSLIVEELAERTGYRVTLGKPPEITIWPRFGAVLREVEFHQSEEAGLRPAVAVRQIDIDLALLASLGGHAELETIDLRSPVFALQRSGGRLEIPRPANPGQLAQIIGNAGKGAVPRQAALGTVRFHDGRIVEMENGRDVATNLGGIASWPMSDAPAQLKASGTWEGTAFQIDAGISAPVPLLQGDASNVLVNFSSELVTIGVRGTVSEIPIPIFDGAIDAKAAKLGDALEWFGIEIGAAAGSANISVSGQASGTLERLRLPEANVTFNETPGAGLLELSIANGIPAVGGTLAFDRLDLLDFFSSSGQRFDALHGDLDFTNQFGLDLRLSAREATMLGQTLSDVAASAQVRPGFAAFNITDATLLDGILQVGFRGERSDQGDKGSLRVATTDIPVAPLLALMGISMDAVTAKTTLTATLTGPMEEENDFLRRMSGTIEGSLSGGAIRKFDVSKLADQTGAGYLPLASLAAGTTTINGGQFKANLSGGVAGIEQATLDTPNEVLWINGIIPYAGRSLAVTCRVEPKAGDTDTSTFFVGGSWDAPFITAARP